MRFYFWNFWIALAGVAGMCCVALVGNAEPPGDGTQQGAQPAAVERTALQEPVSIAIARDRATWMHSVYAATLEVMHEHYFDEEKAVLPARALEDVFTELSRQSKIEARWISVNTKPMSVRHEPKSEFEKQAAKAIAAGKEEFEQVENGRYSRAAAIPLASGCVNCHVGFFPSATKSPRFAGLIISMPVNEK